MRHVDNCTDSKGLRWEKAKSEQCSRCGLGWGWGQSGEGEGAVEAMNWMGMDTTGSLAESLLRAGCFRSWQREEGGGGVGLGEMVEMHPSSISLLNVS